MNTPTYYSCPQCGGSGRLQSNDAQLACTTCLGSGGWLETDNHQKLIYPLPLTVRTGSSDKGKLAVWYGVTSIAATATVASLISMLAQSLPDIGTFLWQKEPANLIFGIAGLATMGSVAMVKQLHTSEQSLHDLEKRLATLPENSTVNLLPYANSRVKTLIESAAKIALEFGSKSIEDYHLLYALFDHPRIQMLLSRLEIDPRHILDDLSSHISKGTAQTGTASVSAQAAQHMYGGFIQAIRSGFAYLDVEDIMIDYATTPSQDYYAELFKDHGITTDNLIVVARWYSEEQERAQTWKLWQSHGRSRSKTYMNRGWTALPTPFTDQFSTDLTLLASYGNVASLTTRREEIETALATLASNSVRNVIFIGEPGSGTETILTALATRILEENVPEHIKDTRFINLDLPRLLTSSDNAQAAMQQVLDEVGGAGNVVLAIPDVQALSDAQNAQLDGSSILANALKNNVIQVVTTASYADYHRYIEQNSLLKSLLQVIELHPLTPEEGVTMLEEEAAHLESTYHIFLTYPALETAVKLAQQYISEEALPKSAYTLLEKAASITAQAGKRWVDKATVQHALEELIHVPVSQAEGAEAEKLLNLESLLHTRVVGQNIAVNAIAEALRRARTGLGSTIRPIGSFLFVGPTGVGKTELAKALSEVYFAPDNFMVRFDMSEYQEPRSIYNLIGAPAEGNTFVEGGELTQAVREHPFSLLLFDEIEKAHPDVLNLFLQMLDDGRITENTGRTIHLNTCIIIATSNAGSDVISQLITQGITAEQLSPQILKVLEKSFKPEFLNRFDAIIPFQPLGIPELNQIAQLITRQVALKAKEQNITLNVTPGALTKLVQLGYNPAYGARPLRRTIEQKIEGIMAKKILNKEIQPGDALQITPEMID